MLDLMRRQSYLIYLVFGGIIFIFAINFGPGSSGCAHVAQPTWAAQVDGEPVRLQQFAMLYQRQLDYMRQLAGRSGTDFDAAMAERLGLRKQVMDQLVDRKLLAVAARAHGIEITDADLLVHLRDQYGVKDVAYDVYENWVARTFDCSVGRFEDDTRDEMAAQRLAQLVGDSITVGDAELGEAFRQAHDRAEITYARFDPDPVAVPEPTAAAVDALLAAEAAAVQAAYDGDQASYMTPQQVRARQIVRPLAADADAATVTAATEALTALAKRAAAGEDLAALAAPEAPAELGWVSRGQLARPLENALFALPPGGVTAAPVRTPQGLHLAQVQERREPSRREFAAVQREVAARLLVGRAAKAAAQGRAEALRGALAAGKPWAALTDAEATAPPVDDDDDGLAAARPSGRPQRRDSGWIERQQEVLPRLGAAPELRAAIFAATLEAPQLPRAYPVGEGFVVASLKAREHPDMGKFDAARAGLLEEAEARKRNRVLRDWLTHLRARAKVQLNPGLLSQAQPAAGS